MASTLKTQATAASVDDFLATVASEQCRKDCKTLVKLMSAATGAKPKMWGNAIVGFDEYVYRYENGRTGVWPIIGFSPRKTNLTLYIMSGFDEYAALMAKLGRHKTGKSCFYLKTLADIDMTLLRTLIDGSIAYMRAKYPRPAS